MKQSVVGRYSKALDAQTKFFQFYSSRKGKVMIEEIAKAAHYGAKKEPGMEEAILPPLGFGETFYWSPEICELIFTASTSIPRTWTLENQNINSLCGFAWLARPFLSNSPDGDPEFVRAIGWVPITTDGDNLLVVLPPYEYNPLLDDSRRNGLAISLFVEMPNLRLPSYFSEVRGWPQPTSRVYWFLGQDLNQMAKEGKGWEGKLAIERMSLFATMLAFLQQKILVPIEYRADKAVSRYVKKTMPERAPQIQVITLRPIQHYEKGGHRDVEWTCRWPVSSHWRNQPYGPAGQKHYRPKYIASYLKGPEDKPLRHPGRLFAVVR